MQYSGTESFNISAPLCIWVLPLFTLPLRFWPDFAAGRR